MIWGRVGKDFVKHELRNLFDNPIDLKRLRFRRLPHFFTKIRLNLSLFPPDEDDEPSCFDHIRLLYYKLPLYSAFLTVGPIAVYSGFLFLWAALCYDLGATIIVGIAGASFFVLFFLLLLEHAYSLETLGTSPVDSIPDPNRPGAPLMVVNERAHLKYFYAMALLGVMFGNMSGAFVAAKFLYPYHAFQDKRQYTDLSSTHPAMGVNDAASLTFQKDVKPDRSKVIGLKAGGKTYCVVPILAPTHTGDVQFWAVGRNCCGFRQDFHCGDVENANAHSGVVLRDYMKEMDPSAGLMPVKRQSDWYYRKALNVSQALYPITVDPEKALLMEWREDATDVSDWRNNGIMKSITAIIGMSIFFFPAGLVLAFSAKKHRQGRIEPNSPGNYGGTG